MAALLESRRMIHSDLFFVGMGNLMTICVQLIQGHKATFIRS
jgi:hypothetical protein